VHAFFDHTGDIGVRLSAATLEDLFAFAAVAFVETVAEPAGFEPRRAIPVALDASGPDLLLVDWLSEILFRFEVEQFLPARVEVRVTREGDGWRLEGTLMGETVDPARHAVKLLVKAVTYHALQVEQTADGWQGTVVFDI
jgi:SHS2 domain-containing protein